MCIWNHTFVNFGDHLNSNEIFYILLTQPSSSSPPFNRWATGSGVTKISQKEKHYKCVSNSSFWKINLQRLMKFVLKCKKNEWKGQRKDVGVIVIWDKGLHDFLSFYISYFNHNDKSWNALFMLDKIKLLAGYFHFSVSQFNQVAVWGLLRAEKVRCRSNFE